MGSKLDEIYSKLRDILKTSRPEDVLVLVRRLLSESTYQLGPIERKVVLIGVYRENLNNAVIVEAVLTTGIKVLIRIFEDPKTGELRASATAFGPVVSVHAPRL